MHGLIASCTLSLENGPEGLVRWIRAAPGLPGGRSEGNRGMPGPGREWSSSSRSDQRADTVAGGDFRTVRPPAEHDARQDSRVRRGWDDVGTVSGILTGALLGLIAGFFVCSAGVDFRTVSGFEWTLGGFGRLALLAPPGLMLLGGWLFGRWVAGLPGDADARVGHGPVNPHWRLFLKVFFGLATAVYVAIGLLAPEPALFPIALLAAVVLSFGAAIGWLLTVVQALASRPGSRDR